MKMSNHLRLHRSRFCLYRLVSAPPCLHLLGRRQVQGRAFLREGLEVEALNRVNVVPAHAEDSGGAIGHF